MLTLNGNNQEHVDDRRSKEYGDEKEEEDEEELDTDFNPLLRETVSPEASSSLSCEMEVLDGNSVDNREISSMSKPSGELNQGKLNKRKAALESQTEFDQSYQEHDVSDVMAGDANKSILMDLDNEDAICKRTRARYSLASFSLEELEEFLQETDDENDFQNVDDQDEYRKFLSAVLFGKDGNDGTNPENETIDDDEDEDNDSDFEIELEEALESDVDEGITPDRADKEKRTRITRRPQTRSKRRHKAKAPLKKKVLSGHEKRPLRPLIPFLPVSLPSLSRVIAVNGTASTDKAFTEENSRINGFSPYQVGKLHCLIYEHVQLLIQIYSLCVLDPSKQHIASNLQRLITEMLETRNKVRARRTVPYPSICFSPQYLGSSVTNEPIKTQCQVNHSSTVIQMNKPQNISSYKGRNSHFWVPPVSGQVLSILDVAPLTLVEQYMTDVCTAGKENRQHSLDSTCETHLQREPLFNFPCLSSSSQSDSDVLRSTIPRTSADSSTTPSQQQFKKTTVASILESAKKQSIAFVPKKIAKLAERFLPLFNPELYPHKPPPASVSNRVLFTDSEDELLALGMMEYNSNWKAIQQRFLPSKSEHQIFIRKKNRCASKAPENCIKAVRRMKASQLTAEEMERIEEGLDVFKLDWMLVWKYKVPHRDPSLLPRQWRDASGAHKSYKQDAAKKESRRLCELNRRNKIAELAHWKRASEIEDNSAENADGEHNSGDDCVGESYLHEAFLADWRPGRPSLTFSGHPSRVNEQANNNNGYAESQLHESGIHKFPSSSNYPLQSSTPYSQARCYPISSIYPHHDVSNVPQNKPKYQVYLRPYRTRKVDSTRLVKLAGDLPTLTLPPSVRVISQSTLKDKDFAASARIPASRATGNDTTGMEKVVSQPLSAKSPTDNSVTPSTAKDSDTDEVIVRERGNSSDLEMHPLLFQASERGCMPYYSLDYDARKDTSFGFLSGNQPQLNLSLFRSSIQSKNGDSVANKSLKRKESTSVSCGVDFHPLLQRANDENNELAATTSHLTQCQVPWDDMRYKLSGHDCSSPKERANELDLNLSPKSTKEQGKSSLNIEANSKERSMISVSESVNARETERNDSSHYQYNEDCPTIHHNFVLDAHASITECEISSCNPDHTGDSSQHEIVMEQEELSDSDEEMDETLEFECEEMTDSDGEADSGSEQIGSFPDKEGVHKDTAKKARNATNADSDNPKCGLDGLVDSQQKFLNPSESGPC